MSTYDWKGILAEMKSFARIDDITDIILVGEQTGEGQGIRRIMIREEEDD